MTPCQALGELLRGSLNQADSFGIALGNELVEAFPADFLARFVAERIDADLSDLGAGLFEQLVESAFAGAVADEALVVLDLEIVAFNDHQRQLGGSVGTDRGGGFLGRHDS